MSARVQIWRYAPATLGGRSRQTAHFYMALGIHRYPHQLLVPSLVGQLLLAALLRLLAHYKRPSVELTKTAVRSAVRERAIPIQLSSRALCHVLCPSRGFLPTCRASETPLHA